MIREKLASDKISERILWLTGLWFLLFFGSVVLSFFLLPKGFLKDYTESRDFETSANLLISTVQIFFFNQIAVIAILIGSVFAKKRKEKERYLTLGYYCFFLMIMFNCVVLGTGSFSVNDVGVTLADRIIGMFQITEHAGLIEMFGELLITCAMADKYLVMTQGKNTTTRSIKEIRWEKQDVICIVLGVLLMLLGAFIESRAILLL